MAGCCALYGRGSGNRQQEFKAALPSDLQRSLARISMKTRNCTLTRSRNGIETAPVRARRARMPVNFGPEGGSHPSSFGRIASIQDRVLSIRTRRRIPIHYFHPAIPRGANKQSPFRPHHGGAAPLPPRPPSLEKEGGGVWSKVLYGY